ncbi:hypothetical protein M5585_19620 [Serratia ureilytica]
MYDAIVIGAGLVGLGVVNALQEADPQRRILILEKSAARRRTKAATTAT